jgi:hypothetical protein
MDGENQSRREMFGEEGPESLLGYTDDLRPAVAEPKAMSHRFKAPRRTVVYVPKRANLQEAQLRQWAPVITDQLQLESLMAQTGAKLAGHQRSQMQRRCFERIRPFLNFRPSRQDFLLNRVRLQLHCDSLAAFPRTRPSFRTWRSCEGRLGFVLRPASTPKHFPPRLIFLFHLWQSSGDLSSICC